MNNILLLEDEESLNRGISFKLQKEGYSVLSCKGVAEGKKLFLNNSNIGLIICDITLEDGNGIDFCNWIRKQSDVRFIFLTALDQEIDIIMGYESGADDYITKPFSLAVLLSKINAVFKRLDGKDIDRIESGAISFKKNEMKVYVNSEERFLSKNELKLLLFLLENPKQILSKQQILENVFDTDTDFMDENTVAVNIRRLREKIEPDASSPVYIKNIRGIGYLWDKECR